MIRFLGVAIALSAGAMSVCAPAHAGTNDRSTPMRFELRLQSAVDGCTDHCAIISASGAITADTPRDFIKFAAGRDLRNATVTLDSDGGSVLGAIALGREIRKRDLPTAVGRVIDAETAEGSAVLARVLSRADCESMCAFVLLAGSKRTVPTEARVMVHQIWLGDRRDDPTAGSYSAEDLVLVQRDIGRLARYTAEMGGPSELLELALRIPPWEPMHALTRDELRQMKLDTEDSIPVASAPVASSTPVPPPSPAATSGTRAERISDRRWQVVDQSGANTLTRRHPLTVEGDQIGRFDLVVACAGPDSYVVNYTEKRFSGETRRDLTPVGGVTLRVGGQVATLKVVSSQKREGESDVDTFATGTVPAAIIKAFTASGPRSLYVTTKSSDLRTVIRIGNTGAAQNLPALTSNCRTQDNRAEQPTPKTGNYAAAQ